MDCIENIGVVLFDGVERLDYEGPTGVFGWTGMAARSHPQIRFLSKNGSPVSDHLVHKPVQVDGSTKDDAQYDLLIVPGGNVPQFLSDQELVDDVRRLGSSAHLLASVCTGAFLVAKAGLANGKTLATHWHFHDAFRQQFPSVLLAEDRRYVNDGSLWSSAGISAGIDMSLRLVASVWGVEVAKKVQGFLEYFPEPPYTRDEVANVGGPT